MIFNKTDGKAVLATRLYYAVFRNGRVRGRIDDAGLRVEFLGKVDRIPQSAEEAHSMITSLFNEPPSKVRLGAVVLAENSKVKVRAWGIKIVDVRALFNRLSTLKLLPIDVREVSDIYGLRIGHVKRILKTSGGEALKKEATEEKSKRYKRARKSVEVNGIKVQIRLDRRRPVLVIKYGKRKVYEGEIGQKAVEQYIDLANRNARELVREAVMHLEGLVNLLGKAGEVMVIPGIIEARIKDGKVYIRTATERAVLPWSGWDGVNRFLAEIRERAFARG